MCGVIGVVLRHPTIEDYALLTRIFHESKIRGMHATGFTYLQNDVLHTERYAKPATQCVFDFPSYVNEDGTLYLIGHCRYSTSDLLYNQPIVSDQLSLVHNGVVSQELPENWHELYGYRCDTKNDTELILRTVEDNESPLLKWRSASISVCELHRDRTFRVYRNGKRPVYLSTRPNGFIITSTADIARRAGCETAEPCPMNCYLTITPDMTLTKQYIDTGDRDLQGVEYA